jgi:hypothetical protein
MDAIAAVLGVIGILVGIQLAWHFVFKGADAIVKRVGRHGSARVPDPVPRNTRNILCRQTGWHQSTGSKSDLVNHFGYQGILSGQGDLTMEMTCSLERAIDVAHLVKTGKEDGKQGMIQPHIMFRIHPGSLANDGYIMGIISSESGERSTGYMTLRAGPLDDGAMLVQISELKHCQATLTLLRSGEDCTFELLLNPKETLLRLPLPLGPSFEPAYRGLCATI